MHLPLRLVINHPKAVALRTVLALCLIASACTRVPQIEDQIDTDLRNQSYPNFIPLNTALSDEGLPQDENAILQTDLDNAAAQLRRRATALRQRAL